MGREKAPINQAAYSTYVGRLKDEGRGFPMNNRGEVNYSEIARQCGFLRQVLYKTLKQKLLDDLEEIGLEGPNEKRPEEHLAQKAEIKTKEASALRKVLDAKVEEINQLRAQIGELENKIRKLENRKSDEEAAMEEMTITGRRCFFI